MPIPAFSVYQNTWQGNQLQYATARTNELVQSNDLTDVAWTATTGVTVTAADNTGPDGTTSAGTIVYDGLTGTAGNDRISQALDTPDAETLVASAIWLKATAATSLRLNNGFGYIPISVTTVWKRFEVPGSADGSSAVELAIASPDGVNNAFIVNYAFAQVEEGTDIATSYIPTTTDAVTVTDYAFNVGGTQIVFSTAPILGSVITGVYENGGHVFSIGTGDGTTTDFDVPTSNTIELAVPQNIYSNGSPYHAFSITPSDTAILAVCTLKIYVGGSGAVSVILNRDDIDHPFTFQAVAHTFYELAASQVLATGTTATGIIGLN